VDAVIERARASVLLAQGSADEAAESFRAAAASFDELGFLPEAARASFGLGRALLRLGQRSRAAGSLAEARDRFLEMGAASWSALVAVELERATPGRAEGELTPTEQRVAGLVAEGMKNKEIAGAMYVSVATVEAHLTRIYRKLGIRSRNELVRLISEGSVDLGPRRPHRGHPRVCPHNSRATPLVPGLPAPIPSRGHRSTSDGRRPTMFTPAAAVYVAEAVAGGSRKQQPVLLPRSAAARRSRRLRAAIRRRTVPTTPNTLRTRSA
jgi:DNA-binding NarL/FixJ family response regulator